MMNASQPHYAFTDYEASFDSQAAVAWAAEHPDLPVFAVALYLAFIFSVPALLEGRATSPTSSSSACSSTTCT